MSTKPKMSTQDMLRAAEQYLAQTESYKEVTLQHLAEFLGVGIMTVYRRLPVPQWERLRNAWIQERLRLSVDIVCAEAKTQGDFTQERIAHVAGMPLHAVHRFLPNDEWESRRGRLQITHEERERQKQPSISTQYAHRAEMYLTQVEKYEEVTLKQFAKFLGEAVDIVYKRLPTYQWEQLRNTWIEKHLRQALDMAFTAAKSQDDFTLKDIARFAEMPYLAVCRFLPEDEWKTRRAMLPTSQAMPPTSQRKSETASRYLIQAETYLAQTEDYEAVMMSSFAKSLGVSRKTISKWLPGGQWEALRNKWIENRLKQAMAATYEEAENQSDFTVAAIARHAGMPTRTVRNHLSDDEWRARRETLPSTDPILLDLLCHAMNNIYEEAKTQEDFTMSKIAALAGVPVGVVRRYAGKEWGIRRGTLPTTKEKVLAALQRAVDARTPISELTRKRIVELADVNGEGTWPWFNQPYQSALRRLALGSHEKVTDPPPSQEVDNPGWLG